MKFIWSSNILNKSSKEPLLKFNEWLAGLIDGDGYFLLTEKGYVSCEITMDIRDKSVLYEVQQIYGGSITRVSKANALKYKLRNKKGLINLINGINGLIRNPARLLQLNKLCKKYNINLKQPLPLTYNNGWLSGFIDSDGSIYLNEKSGQVFISISQKNKDILDPLIKLYGGKIYIISPKIHAFKYVIFRKNELFKLIDEYFNDYPLKSAKLCRLSLIKEFYTLRPHRNKKLDNRDEHNKWVIFRDKWEKYEN